MSNTTTPMANITDGPVPFDINNYKCSDEGLILPLVNEYTWSEGGRAFIYLLGLLWSFLAVAIIADIFMCSIERITSKTTKVRIADPEAENGFREVEVKVWNNTVANLSLLALGTSAPEILLSVIEIVGNNFRAGELGPGTIVGSAAFNLLVISGICVMSIPGGDVRRIDNLRVFGVTSFTCVFAYIWLGLVLLFISPEIVEIWEAVLTFLFFPLLIIVAYLTDKKFFLGKKEEDHEGTVGISLDGKRSGKYEEDKHVPENSDTTDSKLLTGRARSYRTMSGEEGEKAVPSRTDRDGDAELYKLSRELGHEVRDGDVSENEAARLAAAKLSEGKQHDRGWYRVNATRMLTGGRKLVPKVKDTFQELYDTIQLHPDDRVDKDVAIKSKDHSAGGTKSVIEFTASEVAVLENEGKVRIGIRRYGRKDIPATIHVETCNGTALEGEDYKGFSEDVCFGKDEELRQVFIEIVDDFEWEPDEHFYVKLIKLSGDEHSHVACGNVEICQVTIINDDEPGKLEFVKPSLIVKESYYNAHIPVQRVGGCDGHVSVKWRTTNITALEGKDYKGGEDWLKFDNQETLRYIDIPLFESDKKERDESFSIELMECDGGAELGKIKKTIVTIVNDDEFNGIVSRLLNLTKGNLESLQLESSSWVQQFKEAMNVNGGDIENAAFIDYVMHFLTFGWKLIFAFIPPAKYWGGWPTFLISLSLIGLLTALIGDLAGIFGCLIGLPKSITAITFVALGTSMPDTFASKTAAIMEKSADSSVGNVNGSNSVNVFLGLGLPWVIASIYWAVQTHTEDKRFHSPAGTLGFSVIVYTCCAIIAIGILILRRSSKIFGNAELGGPQIPKIVSGIMLISLWFIYVLMSVLQSVGIIEVNF